MTDTNPIRSDHEWTPSDEFQRQIDEAPDSQKFICLADRRRVERKKKAALLHAEKNHGYRNMAFVYDNAEIIVTANQQVRKE